MESKHGCFVAAVGVGRRCETGCGLIGEHAAGPLSGGGVEELLELGCDVPETGWCPEGVTVGPFQVVVAGYGNVSGVGDMCSPSRVGVDGGIGCQLGDAPKSDGGAGLAGSFRDAFGECVHVTGG